MDNYLTWRKEVVSRTAIHCIILLPEDTAIKQAQFE